jgi:hypothetical protein
MRERLENKPVKPKSPDEIARGIIFNSANSDEGLKAIARAIRAERKETKKITGYLNALTILVRRHLAQLDVLMKQPSTPARGKKIAELSNALEMANDEARYFGLHVDYHKDRTMKAKDDREAQKVVGQSLAQAEGGEK